MYTYISSEAEYRVLLGYCAASSDNSLLTLQGGTDRLSRNVGKKFLLRHNPFTLWRKAEGTLNLRPLGSNGQKHAQIASAADTAQVNNSSNIYSR